MAHTSDCHSRNRTDHFSTYSKSSRPRRHSQLSRMGNHRHRHPARENTAAVPRKWAPDQRRVRRSRRKGTSMVFSAAPRRPDQKNWARAAATGLP